MAIPNHLDYSMASEDNKLSLMSSGDQHNLFKSHNVAQESFMLQIEDATGIKFDHKNSQDHQLYKSIDVYHNDP